ncbi:MAG: hypothetical protein JO023_01545 [Chloroflexi bacterium]|nr:hypothetical protein [Chloroflexota bacterium]
MAGPGRGVAVVLGLLVGILAILATAARGGFGPLSVCGVDGWAVCVAWPWAVSLLVWLLFLAFVVLLVAWHVREWRAAAARTAVATVSPPAPLSKAR